MSLQNSQWDPSDDEINRTDSTHPSYMTGMSKNEYDDQDDDHYRSQDHSIPQGYYDNMQEE